jgi:DNA invertase Pin-like site-specific DNA recombinase
MRKAYSYQRFSSIKQKGGDSTKRQSGAAAVFCKQHGLTLVDTFTDEGVSGFKGKNFSNESALSQFLKLVENEKVEPGSVLIVENMDRLSRQSILPCLSKFIEIINKRVSIGVISQNKILDTKSITENPMELMLVLVEFARANNESETKSKRIKSVIAAKIEKANKGEKVWFAVQKPSWIVGFKDGKFVLDDDRVKLVKNIFAHYLAGHSCTRIANDLNKSKIPTLRKFKNGIWTNSTVACLLKNKNCIGWIGINDFEQDNYFPAIVTEKVFQLTQQKLAFNVKNRGGSKYGLVRNLFKNLLTCLECGQVIETKIGSYKNVKGITNHYADYICRGVKHKSGCTNKGRVSVSEFEARIFQAILNLDDFNNQTPQTNDVLDELENKLAKIQTGIGRCMELLDSDELADMKELSVKLARLNGEKGQLVKSIEAEKAKVSVISNTPKAVGMLRDKFSNKNAQVVNGVLHLKAVSKKMVQDELARIKEHLKSTEERQRIRNMMPSVFDGIQIKFGNMPKAFCQFMDGKRISLTIGKDGVFLNSISYN